MKKCYTYLTMLLTVLSFASCVKEFDNEKNAAVVSGTPIEFTIADDATRTLLDLTDGKSVVWEDGDVVGLYYRSRISGTPNQDTMVADNVPYKYDAKTGKFIPVGNPATWDGGKSGDNHTLYVYYPYTEAATAYNEIPTAVPSIQTYDVTAVSNPIVSKAFSGSRLQNATYGEAAAFGPVIQSFAILRLNITNVSGSDIVVSEVKVTNDSHYIASDNITMTHASNISVSGGSAPQIRKKGDNTSKIITVTVENGAVAAGGSIDVRMLILPNTSKADTYTKTYEGSKFTVTVTSDKGEHPAITFDGGKIEVGGRASKNIVLQAPSASEEPETPEFTIGQAVGGGVLYKIDGTTGYVLYPYAAKKKWITNMPGTTVGITKFSDDGREAVAAMKATTEGIENYPAAKYCDDLEGDWYLPSENELLALFDVYTGNKESSRDDFKVVPGDLDPVYLNARKTFDGYILACASDGHILNTAADTADGDLIWSSSTASNNKKARYIRFGSYASLSSKEPTDDGVYARCIKRVDLTSAGTSVDEPVKETYPAPTAGTEGEYDVYLLIGQSNMAGRGELLDEDKTEIPNVYILNSEGKIEAAKNPLNIYSSIRKGESSQKMGPGASFASTIAAQTGKKVLLVVNARGGSAISQWQKGVKTSSSGNTYGPSEATTADFYNEAVTRTKQAMQYGALKGILWHQGCSDQSNTSYMTQLMTLANNLRTDLGGNVPFIAGQLGDWRSSSANFNVRIQGISQYLTYSDWVSSADCIPIVTAESDGEPDLTDPHFNRASQILIGKRYAQKILKMVYEKDYTVE